MASKAIPINHPETEWAEQSSDRIWDAVRFSVKECMAASGIAPEQVCGLSYSATCSLVLLDREFQALPLSEGEESWNVIVWMDHRAINEAEEVTELKSGILDNVGGVMSPEMEIPKLMWLKRNRPDLWERLGFAGELADFLTFRSSGSFERSVCTLTCKWTYDPDNSGWDKVFLRQVGLDDLLEKARLPDNAVCVGAPIGTLTEQAAIELGLTTDCYVAAGLIDAHAGAMGTIGLFADAQIERRMALIAGTSNCHIALSKKRLSVPGIWGPYSGAVLDEFWCTEGGQSATGALLDHIVSLFGRDRSGANIHGELSARLKSVVDAEPEFAAGVHVIPDFIGNRAPFADPDLRGSITGLTIENTDTSFDKIYWAAAASIAYGTRLIIDRMNRYGYRIDTLHLSGGHKKSPLLVDLYADVTGCNVAISQTEEPVLLGAAIAALSQFEERNQVKNVTKKMNSRSQVHVPRTIHRITHNQRYAEFRKHYDRHGVV